MHNCAEKKEDEKLLLRIRDEDLHASGARFHKTCRKDYIQKPEYWRSKCQEDKEEQDSMEQAHSRALKETCEFIRYNIIEKKTIHMLTELNEIYKGELRKTSFRNEKYRTEN